MALSSPKAAAAPRAAHVPAVSHPPTEEQQAILDVYHSGAPRLVVEALAGTGKTTMLRMLAATSHPTRRGVYIGFNKAIVLAAAGQFPEQVEVTTAHSLAYRAVGYRYRHRLNSRRLSGQDAARVLHLQPVQLSGATLSPVQVARLAQAMVGKFIKSTDQEICGMRHLPDRAAHLGAPARELADCLQPVANKIWKDLTNPAGQMWFTHDHYFKMWALGEPNLPFDYVMFDEAQDADPVMAGVIARQQGQLVYVGDRNQQMYGWRGAVDAMGQITDSTRLSLTKSFRFGPAIADAANDWLELIGSDLRLRGHDPVDSRIVEPGSMADPRAVLCRTNGTALEHVLRYQERGVPVALAPGDNTAGKDILSFAWAANALMNGRGTDHPDLCVFNSWGELLEFVQQEEDTDDLKRLVGIINRLGPSTVIDAIKRLTPEHQAKVTVSTAHKAKGLEWDRVRVADDFVQTVDADGDPIRDREALMVNYVTVTRARRELDPGSLADPGAWV